MTFNGSIVASITPFSNGKIDFLALENIIEFQITSGTQGFVACGSTGEAALLTLEEWEAVLLTFVQKVNKRIPVIAGCGAPSTHQTVAQTRRAKELGADAALIVAPYYVKPNPEGIWQHYKTVSDAVDIPVIIYNNPGRAGVDFSVETILRLTTLRNVVALKDSNTNLARVPSLREGLEKPFALLSGDDPSAADYLKWGGDGVISVTANVVPDHVRALCDAGGSFYDGENLEVLNEALGLETNPSPIKYAVSKLGFCTEELRLPLVPIQQGTRQKIDEALSRFGGKYGAR